MNLICHQHFIISAGTDIKLSLDWSYLFFNAGNISAHFQSSVVALVFQNLSQTCTTGQMFLHTAFFKFCEKLSPTDTQMLVTWRCCQCWGSFAHLNTVMQAPFGGSSSPLASHPRVCKWALLPAASSASWAAHWPDPGSFRLLAHRCCPSLQPWGSSWAHLVPAAVHYRVGQQQGRSERGKAGCVGFDVMTAHNCHPGAKQKLQLRRVKLCNPSSATQNYMAEVDS